VTPPTHGGLRRFVEDFAALTTPAHISWCDGSPEEYHRLCQLLVDQGTFRRLDEVRHPNSFWARSDPRDVARVEERTFICSAKEEDAGPTNNWADPHEMRERLYRLFSGAMQGRTMYVLPFSMGPIGSPIARFGVQLTDSPYVAVSMAIMTRMGSEALSALGEDGEFVPCLHSVGMPLGPGTTDVAWPCDPENLHIAHFPESREIWSYGSGYGGNALLGKKCLSLRIASVIARDEGWLAEHMLISKLTAPSGEARYIAAAFPSACGKTNLAMLVPSLPGWKVETIGDDICWMKIASDGRLHAINPELGFFGVAPGTNASSNPNALRMVSWNTIFTNTAFDDHGDVWWEGLSDHAPEHLTDWQGRAYRRGSDEPAAHPNARFTTPLAQGPVAPEWQDPDGVPISAILFGGRRATTVPLVYEAFDWPHGVFIGSTMASQTTAAATGAVGQLRRDPFAMLPFYGYHMADHWAHWLTFAERIDADKLPRIFSVNWFRTDADGRFLWPGFGDNARVLAWVFDRCAGRGAATTSPIGYVPAPGALDVDGLALTEPQMHALLRIDAEEWRAELDAIGAHYAAFGDRLPLALETQRQRLADRLLGDR